MAGRPSSYKEEYVKQAYRLSLLGLTDAEMADVFGVSETTLNNWKREYPEFVASIKKGKRPANAKVAASLFKRACGFTKGDTYYPPDVAAAFIWLKNREPELWKDKKEPINAEINFKDVADSIRGADTSE